MRPFLAVLLAFFTAHCLLPTAHCQQFLRRPVSAWAEDLKKGDVFTRRSAAFALGKCGIAAAGRINDLIAALEDSDEGVREAAAFALGELGPLAESATPALGKLLQNDPTPVARRGAACALGMIGRGAEEGGEVLRHALADRDPRVRQNAAWALGQLGRPAVAKSVSELRKLLHDVDLLVRRDAVQSLAMGGEDARAAADDLLPLLQDEDPALRIRAATALGKIGVSAHRAAPPLLAILGDVRADKDLRRNALEALSQTGGFGLAPAVEPLRQLLADTDPAVREFAALGLFRAGEAPRWPQGEQARALAGSVLHPGPRAFVLALQGAMPNPIRPALPDLAAALTDATPAVRRNAAAALSRLGPEALPALPALALALKDEVAEVRQQAEVALSLLKEAAEPALHELLEALKDRDRLVRKYALFALAYLNVPERRLVREALINVAKNDDVPIVRYQAAFILANKLGPDAHLVADTLVDMLRDPDATYYQDVRGAGEASSQEGSPGSTQVIETAGGDARVEAARALGRIGKKAGPAAKRALEEAARDPNPALRDAARAALKEFPPVE